MLAVGVAEKVIRENLSADREQMSLIEKMVQEASGAEASKNN